MKRYKLRYNDIRNIWVEWRIREIKGLTHIPGLCFPGSTTEQRAFSGCIGIKQVTANAPMYYPPDKPVKLFERGFRDLKQDYKIAIIGKYVLECFNTEIARAMNYSESKVRYDLKRSDAIMREYIFNNN